jgi:hypothetical protein
MGVDRQPFFFSSSLCLLLRHLESFFFFLENKTICLLYQPYGIVENDQSVVFHTALTMYYTVYDTVVNLIFLKQRLALECATTQSMQLSIFIPPLDANI